jgi:hypothetical protein
MSVLGVDIGGSGIKELWWIYPRVSLRPNGTAYRHPKGQSLRMWQKPCGCWSGISSGRGRSVVVFRQWCKMGLPKRRPMCQKVGLEPTLPGCLKKPLVARFL